MIEETAVDVPTRATTLEQVALGIAGTIQERGRDGGAMSRGERAELRRMRDDSIAPEPFWTLVGRYDLPLSQDAFWKSVVPLMVEHPHRKGVPPGRALAAAGVSAPRIERWLRLSKQRARQEARRLLVRLDEGLDWTKFAPLLFYWSMERKRKFARDYFLSPEHRERRKAARKESN